MKNSQIILIFLGFACLILFNFMLDTAVKWKPGIKHIGTFEVREDVSTVYDIKAGNRACLAIVTKFKGQNQNHYFFSCPQER